MKSYIWTLPSRVFHWLLASFILLAFLSDEDNLLTYHAIIGYCIFIILTFRVFWGFIGPKYSKFSDFSFGKKELKSFLTNILNPKKEYAGHNPTASYIMIAIIIVTFLTVISGILTFGIQEGKGLLSFLNDSYFKEMKFFKELHEALSTLLIVLIAIHLGGVLSDKLLHPKYETLKSIFTGYKKFDEDKSVKLNVFQKAFALVFLILFLLFLIFNFTKQGNFLLLSKYEPVDYEIQNSLFVSECGSCHILYPPESLPKKSWELLMSDLKNHFGEDASLLEEDNKNILNFLLENSAQTSTKEYSVKILNSIGNKDIIAITQTSFWKKEHKNIPKEIFENEKIKTKANCKACHTDIEKGLIEDDKIKNINSFM